MSFYAFAVEPPVKQLHNPDLSDEGLGPQPYTHLPQLLLFLLGGKVVNYNSTKLRGQSEANLSNPPGY